MRRDEEKEELGRKRDDERCQMRRMRRDDETSKSRVILVSRTSVFLLPAYIIAISV